MPVQPTYPGVYVQEVTSWVRTITGVSTSVAVFIGRAKLGPANEPVLCLTYSDFERAFSSNTSKGDLPRAIRLFFQNGGTQCYVLRLAPGAAAAFASLPNEPNDGDSFTATAKSPGVEGNNIRLTVTYEPGINDAFNLKIFRAGEVEVENWSGISMNPNSSKYLLKYVKSNLVDFSAPGEKRPGVVLDAPLASGVEDNPPTADAYKDAFLNIDRKVDLFNLLILPKDTGFNIDTDLWGAASTLCQQRRAFLLMDAPDTWATAQDGMDNVSSLRTGLVKDHSAIFYPYLTVRENGLNVPVGPSGAIAGLIARTDANRGVWKAPAGTEADIRGITGLKQRFSDGENGVLNPRGINTLRVFPNGIVNWGARTMDGDDNFASEWKYIPIRRTALFIEESLYRGLKWVVFEPNDEPLWAQIRLNVGAFMHNLFRQGAFQGQTKREAYFVKCDAETTTQNDINLGIVNVWVGFAPLKPAEFVILYLQQMAGQIQS